MLMWATGHADHRRAADLGEPRPDEPPYPLACELPHSSTTQLDPTGPGHHHCMRWCGTSGPSYPAWAGGAGAPHPGGLSRGGARR